VPIEVTNKYTGVTIATVATARRTDLDAAIAAALRAKTIMAAMPAHKRAEILLQAAVLLRKRSEELAITIAAEAGKAIKFARAEVDRAQSAFTIAAEEAKRLHGETLPLDAVPSGEGYFGFWVRRPVGVIAAISPFNFPLNLVAHKIAPAIAAGNAVVLKPASKTPLTACKLCRILEEAGLPAGAINLVIGSGGTVGEWLITDPRVDKITFTGSPEIGRHILSVAGIKKVTLELGNASPVIVAPDADLDFAARRCAFGAYYNSGQVCISVQRIYCQKEIYVPFLEKFVAASRAMVVGDPLDERVDIGPMIDLKEARRIDGWVREAVDSGAKIACGGKQDGPLYAPTVLTGVNPAMKVVKEEVFGPVASVIRCENFEDALHQADDSRFALQAGVFTRDIDRVFKAIDRLNFGGVIINDIPAFRTDHMPYGGNRQSGLGREGVRFAMEEMTNIQMVAIRTGS
jgi:acyl-CoA reductase-like NAD-dependent aldehyde dehydrogenase